MDKLMDQPGDCLRDNVDDMELHPTDSLADISPPLLHVDDDDSNNSNFLLVDTAAKMQRCADELLRARPTELALDLEAFNVNKHTQLTCLLQIATHNSSNSSISDKEYVIDTLAPGVWTHVALLRPLFADPSVVKIAHSAGSLDARCLHRDFGIFVVNLFDTYEAARELQLSGLSLAAVCAHYGLEDGDTYVQLKATYQSGDWRIRPLTPGMIRYARYDVHYLVRLRQLMMRDMVLQQRQNNYTDRIVTKSLAETLAQIARAEEDAVSDKEHDENGDAENFQTPAKSVDSDGLAFMDAEEENCDVNDGDDHQEENADNPPLADSDDDSAFKTAVGPTRFDDGLFYTPRKLGSRAASSLDDSFLDAQEDLFSPDKSNPTKISTADLRLQPVLMRVITTSQERCRNLWKADREPHRDNALFQSILKRSKHHHNTFIAWEPSSTDLYDLLAAWREDVATQLECLPGFVAPLDFLVAVAWKRPTTEHGLRRINTRLTPALDQHSEYRDQLLDRVLQFALRDGGSRTATVALFSNLNLPTDGGDATTKSKGLGSSLSLFSSNALSLDTALKVLVVGLLCEGFFRVALDARRKYR